MIVRTEERDALYRALASAQIGSQVHYYPVHLQPYYRRRFGTGPGMCPEAEAYYAQALSLPLFPSMSDADQARVIKAVRRFVADPTTVAVAAGAGDGDGQTGKAGKTGRTGKTAMTEFIAEISSNHNGDLDRCRQLIAEAARVGCTGVKFQLFRIDELFAPEILRVSPTPSRAAAAGNCLCASCPSSRRPRATPG